MMKLSQLTPADFVKDRSYFENQRYELCSYSLSSIIAWSNAEYQPLGAVYKDAFIVAAEFAEAKKNRHLLLPVSPQRMLHPDELVTVAKHAGYTAYWFVPGSYVDHFGEDVVGRHFKVEHQPAYDDYIYRVDDMADLKGSRYAKKRNLIKQFQRNYVDPGKVVIDPISMGKSQCEIVMKNCSLPNGGNACMK